MAFTTDQYEKLQDAISQGVMIVKYADKEIQYRSLDDMIRTAALMADALGLSNNNSSRAIRSSYKSGLNNCSPGNGNDCTDKW
jgi:hypothetical protein